MPKILCSVEILTRNSEQTLERCLESVKDFAEIIILDGNSTDGTLEIARRHGCKIFKQYDTDTPLVRISDFSEVRNKGLKLAKYDWFMYIDSDEYLSLEAMDEIHSLVTDSRVSFYAFWQIRKYVLDGHVIECATTYPNKQIRLFHRDHIEGFKRPIHERIVLKKGVIAGLIKNPEFVPREGLRDLRERWGRYTDREIKMYVGASRRKILRTAARHFALFFLYCSRYLKNLFICRGERMPLSYEWAQHKYLLIFAARLLNKLL